MSTNGGPVSLFKNEAVGPANHSLRVKLVGTKSNRDGIGAVCSRDDGGRHAGTDVAERIELFVGGELVLTFGVGQQTKVNSVEIRWPSGKWISSRM